MSADPAISVVMSVHNGAPYATRAIESILEQQGVAFEFIIIDDGSTDDTPRLLDDHASRDSRIRLIRQSHLGLTQALIRGCAEARSPFIARQDADDLSLPGRLAALSALLAADPDVAFVSSSSYLIGPANEVLDVCSESTGPAAATHALRFLYKGPRHGSVMFRRSAYLRCGGYRPEFYFSQDNDLWFRMADFGQLAYVPGFLYAYRYTPQCISGAWRFAQRRIGLLARKAMEARRDGKIEVPILREAADIRPPFPDGDSQRALALSLCFIGDCLRARRDPRARSYYLQAVRHGFRQSVRASRGLAVSLLTGRKTHARNLTVKGQLAPAYTL